MSGADVAGLVILGVVVVGGAAFAVYAATRPPRVPGATANTLAQQTYLTPAEAYHPASPQPQAQGSGQMQQVLGDVSGILNVAGQAWQLGSSIYERVAN